jgi:hypothetical protein
LFAALAFRTGVKTWPASDVSLARHGISFLGSDSGAEPAPTVSSSR